MCLVRGTGTNLNEVSAFKRDAALDLSGLVAMTANLRHAQSEEVVFEGVSDIPISSLTPRSLCFAGRALSIRISTQIRLIAEALKCRSLSQTARPYLLRELAIAAR